MNMKSEMQSITIESVKQVATCLCLDNDLALIDECHSIIFPTE